MIGYVAVAAVGYVMGTKAGRRRYEQLAGTYRAVTSSPAAKSVIEAGPVSYTHLTLPTILLV